MPQERNVVSKSDIRPAAVRLRRMIAGRGKADRVARLRRVNIGAGLWFRPGWATVDLYAPSGTADFLIDLRQPATLPFADGRLSLAFTSHLLEHLTDAQVTGLLGECARVLEPGGVLRISVPSAESAIAAYRRGDRSFFETGGVTCKGPTLEHLLVNFLASYRDERGDHGPDIDPDDVKRRVEEQSLEEFGAWCVAQIPSDATYVAHVNAYDFAKLERMLKAAGFSEVVQSQYRASKVPELRHRKVDNRPRVSLYVEATK
jgi:predicted SAM-dependent methyltransferase